MANAERTRCKAETKRGRCKVERGLNAEGLCPMHAGTTDPKELGRKSAKARAKPNPDRVHPVLRDYLLENVAPSEVWEALQLALRGSNESARVSAARLLLDALRQEQKEKQHDAWVADAAADFDRRLADGIKRHREIVAGMLRTDHPAHPGNQAHGPFHDGSGWGMMIELLRLGEVERQYLAIPEGVRNQFLLEAEPSDEPESTVRRATDSASNDVPAPSEPPKRRHCRDAE